jgi:RNase P subunit RPR2
MTVQSAFEASPRVCKTELRRPHCPRCGGMLLFAEESRFNTHGRIDHDWSCDGCGHKFITSVRLWRRSSKAA